MDKLVDCIHIGLHKTGSTWLQLNGLLKHPNIELLNKSNSNTDKCIVNEFIGKNDFDFNDPSFKIKFMESLQMDNILITNKIKMIAEENLSGHIYSGNNAKVLADRIYETFGDVKILIVLREQLSWIVSAYNNYLKHGGALKLDSFLKDIEIPVLLRSEKLCYHKIVGYYIKLFKKNNVKILLYEQLKEDANSFMENISYFLGVKSYKIQNIKPINTSFSNYISNMIRFSNGLLGERNRYINKVGEISSKYIRFKININKYLDKNTLNGFMFSNRLLQDIIDVDLKKYGYLI